MAAFNDIEIGLLQEARSAFPDGIASDRDQNTAEYRALVRLIKAGLLEPEDVRQTYRGVKHPDYHGVNITEAGREELDSDESAGDAERAAYVNVILIVLKNPKVQLDPADVDRIKVAVRDAPLSKLRDVVGFLGTVATLGELGVKLVASFLGG